MDDAAVKESRQILRRIQDHLTLTYAGFGVEHETVGFVDVIHHPTNLISDLNFVTPRRNTAYVSGKFVQNGLDRLQALGRDPSVHYIEGLFPPMFTKTLSDLGLHAEYHTSIMAFSFAETLPHLLKPRKPAGVRVEVVSAQNGVAMWRKVLRNPEYSLLTLGVEPLAAGRDLLAQRGDNEVDALLYRQDQPIGVARLSVQPTTQSGHIVALAFPREARSRQLIKLLMVAALHAGLARGCNLVFTSGEGKEARALNQELGFVDIGSVVCYAARSEKANEVTEHDSLAQPVLALRG